jgi:hypothetical protein
MVYSPYLSIEVLATVAGKESPFTHTMIRNILMANPHGARSVWVQNVLDNRTTLLSQLYRSDIDGVKGLFTGKDTIDIDESDSSYKYDLIHQELLFGYLNDSNDHEGDVDSLLLHPANAAYHYVLAEKYFDLGKMNEYATIVNNIPTNFQFGEREASYHTSFMALFSQLNYWRQGGLVLYEKNDDIREWLLNFRSNNTYVPTRVYSLLALNDSPELAEPTVYIPDDSLGPGPQPTDILVIENENSSINIYPNPGNSYLTFEWKSEAKNAEVLVLDLNGRNIFEGSWKAGEKFTLNTSAWAMGAYYAHIKLSNGEIIKRKILVIH